MKSRKQRGAARRRAVLDEVAEAQWLKRIVQSQKRMAELDLEREQLMKQLEEKWGCSRDELLRRLRGSG
ncbi:MAG: hypothetical protein ABI992_05455 [Chthoniobacterales bacterium]